MLLCEKERTRNRFAQMRQVVGDEDDDEDCEAAGERKKIKKKTMSQKILQIQNLQSPVLAQKVCASLKEDILSLCHQSDKGLLPLYTPFSFSEEDNLQNLLHEMKRQCPLLCSSERRQELVFMVLSYLEE